MKKCIACLFLLMILFIVSGCGKEEDEPIVIGGLIEASASTYNPPYGGTSTVTWEILNPSIYERIMIKKNNVVISTLSKGNETLSSITQPQKISISCFKKGETEPSLEKKLDDIIPQDVVEPKIPSLTSLTADPPTLPIGGGITNITWTSNENTLSVVHNGVSYPPSCTLPVSVTSDSTRLVFEAHGSDGLQRSSTILIRVEQEPLPPPPLTVEDTLCMGGWKLFKLEFENAQGQWDPQNIWECQRDDVLNFYLIPQQKAINYFGEIRCGDEPEYSGSTWSLSGNILTLGQAIYESVINQDTLILVSGSELKVRQTFIH